MAARVTVETGVVDVGWSRVWIVTNRTGGDAAVVVSQQVLRSAAFSASICCSIYTRVARGITIGAEVIGCVSILTIGACCDIANVV